MPLKFPRWAVGQLAGGQVALGVSESWVAGPLGAWGSWCWRGASWAMVFLRDGCFVG